VAEFESVWSDLQGIAFEQGSPASLPLAAGSADVAVSNLALAEAADPRAGARELGRVLAPGGEAVVTAAQEASRQYEAQHPGSTQNATAPNASATPAAAPGTSTSANPPAPAQLRRPNSKSSTMRPPQSAGGIASPPSKR